MCKKSCNNNWRFKKSFINFKVFEFKFKFSFIKFRTALEISYDSDKDILINVNNVNSALEQVYGSKLKNTGIQDFIEIEGTKETLKPSQKINKSNITLPFQQSLILCCILRFNNVCKSNFNVDIKQIYNFYCDKCIKLKVECLNFEEILQILSILESRALISFKTKKKKNAECQFVFILKLFNFLDFFINF